MEKNVNIVKGTHDIIDDEMELYGKLLRSFSFLATRYGYKEIVTPTIEHTNLFARSVGDSSDIVSKEMYTFLDKGDRSITLRPEMTAGVLRAIVSNKMTAQRDLPLRLFYNGSCFRYERPQAGRYREFHQFGVETLGVRLPSEDLEVVLLGIRSLQSAGLDNVKIKINYLGNEETRSKYREALKEYFKDHIENMCEDCKHRYETNPLRILDCKVNEDRPIIDKAPNILDFLSEEDKKVFDFIVKGLEKAKCKVEIDPTLVRGLDYYTGIVFEYHSDYDDAPNFGAIGGGGHYSKLLSELGGPDLEGIGFSFGMERVVALMHALNKKLGADDTIDCYLIGLNEEAIEYNVELADEVRNIGFAVLYNHEVRSMKSMMKYASKIGAKFVAIIGEDELEKKVLTLKDMETQEQTEVDFEHFLSKIIEGLLKKRQRQAEEQFKDELDDLKEGGKA